MGRKQHGSAAAAAAASGEVRMSAAADARTVVVTGLGVVSGMGTGVEAFWEGLLKGESSVNRIEGFDPERFKCQIGSEVREVRSGIVEMRGVCGHTTTAMHDIGTTSPPPPHHANRGF